VFRDYRADRFGVSHPEWDAEFSLHRSSSAVRLNVISEFGGPRSAD